MEQIKRSAVKESLEELLRFVSEHAERQDFSALRVKEVELAVEEALVNILTYAYPMTTGEVSVRCENKGEALVVSIIDHGIAFDPLTLPVPDLLAELASRHVGGLGVFFVRNMTENVEYRREGDTNILTLIFGKTAPLVGD
jgi:anti-sigma regulatory factor (Ser/Thr protein kinase)